MAANYKEVMGLSQALTLLADLAELEVISPACPDPPPGWIHELEQAAQVTRRFLAEQRPPPGEFFISGRDRTRTAEKNLKKLSV